MPSGESLLRYSTGKTGGWYCTDVDLLLVTPSLDNIFGGVANMEPVPYKSSLIVCSQRAGSDINVDGLTQRFGYIFQKVWHLGSAMG